jgi:small subunit ribosomal protein S9
VTDESTPVPAEDATVPQDAAAEPEAVEETTDDVTATEAEAPAAEAPAAEAESAAADAPEAGAPEGEAAAEGESAETATEAAAETSETATAETPEPAPAAAEEPAARPAPRRAAASKGGKPTPSLGTGRRKGAVARVRLVQGSGLFDLDGRTLEDVFPNRAHRMQITAPLRIADRERDLDVLARLHGGGVSGQAGALRHGIARALIELDPELRGRLKAEGFLTRDSREKERRKYGLKKARKAPQYSKR